MGRKDTSSTQLPVDSYRRHIGKQDVKKAKQYLKDTKRRAQAKVTVKSTYVELGIMVGVMLLVISSVYIFLYSQIYTAP